MKMYFISCRTSFLRLVAVLLLAITCTVGAAYAFTDDHPDNVGEANANPTVIFDFGQTTNPPPASGGIQKRLDRDVFKIIVPVKGIVTLNSFNSNIPMHGALYDISNNFLVSNSMSPKSNEFRIPAVLDPGTYFIDVGRQGSEVGGSYQVQSSFAAAQPDDHVDSIQEPMTNPSSILDHNGGNVLVSSGILGSIEDPNDTDIFQVVLPTRSTVLIGTQGQTPNVIRLLNTSGQSVAWGSSSGNNGVINKVLDAGTYFLEIKPGVNKAGGPYGVQSSVFPQFSGPGGAGAGDPFELPEGPAADIKLKKKAKKNRGKFSVTKITEERLEIVLTTSEEFQGLIKFPKLINVAASADQFNVKFKLKKRSELQEIIGEELFVEIPITITDRLSEFSTTTSVRVFK